MMPHVTGQSRYQSTLFPEALDEVVSADHQVRVIDAFVDTLDLARLGFSKVEAEDTGRSPYLPGDLLKLYLRRSSWRRRPRLSTAKLPNTSQRWTQRIGRSRGRALPAPT
jgi:hypothetical protein